MVFFVCLVCFLVFLVRCLGPRRNTKNSKDLEEILLLRWPICLQRICIFDILSRSLVGIFAISSRSFFGISSRSLLLPFLTCIGNI